LIVGLIIVLIVASIESDGIEWLVF